MAAGASRRRLMAGLVLLGLAPMKALAASHNNPGGGWNDDASSDAAPSASSLPDCVLSEVDLTNDVTLDSQVTSGNLIEGFILHCRPPASVVKLTGLKLSGFTDQVDLSLTCQLTTDAPDGFVVKKLELYLPELNAPGKTDAVPLGASTLMVGATSTQKPQGDDGELGTELVYDDSETPGDFADLAKALGAGGAVSFSAVAADSAARKIGFSYTLPRLAGLYALAKPKLDKLKSDAAGGLCKLPNSSSDADYMAKFCTTAAIEVIGLQRDCWELRALHAFRRWMRRDPVHALEAAEYAERAPGVVRGVGRRHDAGRIWLWAYFTGVLPAAAAARLGANPLARLIYRRMCLALVRLAAPEQA